MVAIQEELRIGEYKFSGVLVDDQRVHEEVNRPNNPDVIPCPLCGKNVTVEHDNLYHWNRHMQKYHPTYPQSTPLTEKPVFAIGQMVHINLNSKVPCGKYPVLAVERKDEKTRYTVALMPHMPYGVSETVLMELNPSAVPAVETPIIEASRDATPSEVATVEPVAYGVQAPAVELPEPKKPWRHALRNPEKKSRKERKQKEKQEQPRFEHPAIEVTREMVITALIDIANYAMTETGNLQECVAGLECIREQLRYIRDDKPFAITYVMRELQGLLRIEEEIKPAYKVKQPSLFDVVIVESAA